jgi:hypothetical protein
MSIGLSARPAAIAAGRLSQVVQGRSSAANRARELGTPGRIGVAQRVCFCLGLGRNLKPSSSDPKQMRSIYRRRTFCEMQAFICILTVLNCHRHLNLPTRQQIHQQ